MNPKIWQCVLCGWHTEKEVEAKPDLCPKCNCKMFRVVTDAQPLDHVQAESIKHLTTKVEKCFQYDQKPGEDKVYHPLKLVREVDKSKAHLSDPKMATVTIREVCETCGQLYSQKNIPVTRTDLLAKEGITI